MAVAKLFKVFVYGTLKKGEPNHGWFEKAPDGQVKFISEAVSEEKYPLIIGTKFNIPFLLYKPGVGYNVKGELYEVDEKVLENLDILEDHPNFYVRDLDPVRLLSDDSTETAWIYFIKNFKDHLLEQPMYESYSDLGDHGLRYVVRYDRDRNYSPRDEIFDNNSSENLQ